MNVLYNGTDISDMVKVEKAVHEMYLRKRADTLEVRFDNTDGTWTIWKPEIGDSILLKEQYASTGTMYVSELVPEKNTITIYASVLKKTDMLPAVKAWEHIYLNQMIQEIANRHSLAVEFYGVKDRLYGYALQSEADFSFLYKRLYLENCSFLVYDGKMIVYSLDYMKEKEAIAVLDIRNATEYRFTEGEKFGSCRITNGTFEGRYGVNDSLPELARTLECNIQSIAEANRYAENIYLQESENAVGWILFPECQTELSAGSVVELQTDFPNWNTKVLLEHVRNNYIKNITKLWFRRL